MERDSGTGVDVAGGLRFKNLEKHTAKELKNISGFGFGWGSPRYENIDSGSVRLSEDKKVVFFSQDGVKKKIGINGISVILRAS